MKKKCLVWGMSFVMAMGILTGCGSSATKEEYQEDIKELAELGEIDTGSDTSVILDELGNITENMDVVTSEGKAVKESLEEYVEYVNGTVLANLATIDEEELQKVQEKTTEICDNLVENMDEFKENAKSAGVSEDELSTIENIGMLGL